MKVISADLPEVPGKEHWNLQGRVKIRAVLRKQLYYRQLYNNSQYISMHVKPSHLEFPKLKFYT